MSLPVLISKPMYRLGHPGKKLFLLYKITFIGSESIAQLKTNEDNIIGVFMLQEVTARSMLLRQNSNAWVSSEALELSIFWDALVLLIHIFKSNNK